MNGKGIILFDGHCGLCVPAVQFVRRRDREGWFRFASLQSPAGRDLARHHGIDAEALSSVVLIESGRAFVESEAALRIARRLPGPLRLLWLLRWVPRALRDGLYSGVARRRYRWFGRLDRCWAPPEADRDRFLPEETETRCAGAQAPEPK